MPPTLACGTIFLILAGGGEPAASRRFSKFWSWKRSKTSAPLSTVPPPWPLSIQTVLIDPDAPHTTLSVPTAVPQTRLSSPYVPQTMGSPVFVLEAPHVTVVWNALAPGLSVPPVNRWLPQMICLLQISSVGCCWSALAVA